MSLPQQETNKEENEISSELTRRLYSHLAKINGEINRMDPKKLKSKLIKYNLNIEGSIDVQRKRLKHFYRKVKLASANIYINQELLSYYVVIDFEATCEVNNPDNYKHEIIEFPAALVNSKTLKIEDTFRKYCRPSVNPILSSFCNELTGIEQEDVDKADTFPTVINEFSNWLEKHQLGSKYEFAVVTDGPWDTCRFLYAQCLLSNLAYPEWAKKWVNIRKVFSSYYKFGRPHLTSMLDYLGLYFEGRRHCGLDDATNIAKILIHLMCDGANIQVNESLTPQALRAQQLNRNCEKLEEMLGQMSLEGEKMSIKTSTKPSTFDEVRKERFKVEAKLALKLKEGHSSDKDGTEDEAEAIAGSPHRRKNKTNQKKKKKKTRNFY